MAQPEISVIITVFNAEAHLPNCLNSVLAQTFTDFELICINDGASDACPEILDRYALQDPRIKVIHQKNVGQYPTRNVAFDYFTGRYVIYIDCDDVVDEHLLEKCFYRAEANSADITMLGWDYLNGSFESPNLSTWGLNNWNRRINDNKFPMGFGYIWMKLYRTDFLRRHNLRFHEEFYAKSDVIFHWQTMALANNICVVREPLYHYRVHENSITGSIGQKFIDVIYVMETIKNELVALHDPKEMLPAWGPFALPFIHSAYQQLSQEHRQSMRNELRKFLARLEENDKKIIKEPGYLSKDIRYFYLALEPGFKFIRYRWLHNLSKFTKITMRKLLLPAPLKRQLVKLMRRQSNTLSNRPVIQQKETMNELNTEVEILAQEVYKLRQKLHDQDNG